MLVKSTGTFVARNARASAQAPLVARLDHRSVERRQIGSAGLLVVRDRLVPEPAHDEFQQCADITVGLADEDPCHARRIVARRRDCEIGMV